MDNGTLFGLLDEAERSLDKTERKPLYERANRLIMELLPGVPSSTSDQRTSSPPR